jgi:predicted metal-dependent peptidase
MHIKDVIMQLLLKQPFYGYIAAAVTPVESSEIPSVSVVMTPAPRLLYNRDWFEGLKEEHAIGAVMHELLHMVLLHDFRRNDRERKLWAAACDMAVNEHIDAALLPADAITVEKISREIRETLPRQKSAESYYDLISKTDNKPSFAENDKEIRIIMQSGLELKANKSIEGDTSEVNKNAVKSMLSELVEQARAEGEIPTGVGGFIGEIYKTGEVNWRNVLKRFVSGKGRTVSRKTCKKESRRFENLPGNKRSVGVDVLLALDESGSISESHTVKFYNELMAIKKITGVSVSITRFDTECTQPVPIEWYVRSKERLKNGGTDFRPVFELADRLHIPLLIVFTDGEGPAPEHANQKVLWVLTKDGKKPAEYGHCITFET